MNYCILKYKILGFCLIIAFVSTTILCKAEDAPLIEWVDRSETTQKMINDIVLTRSDGRGERIPLVEISNRDSVKMLEPVYIDYDNETEYCITSSLEQGISYQVFINGAERKQSIAFSEDGILYSTMMSLRDNDYSIVVRYVSQNCNVKFYGVQIACRDMQQDEPKITTNVSVPSILFSNVQAVRGGVKQIAGDYIVMTWHSEGEVKIYTVVISDENGTTIKSFDTTDTQSIIQASELAIDEVYTLTVTAIPQDGQVGVGGVVNSVKFSRYKKYTVSNQMATSLPIPTKTPLPSPKPTIKPTTTPIVYEFNDNTVFTDRRKGDRDEIVEKVQKRLIELGYLDDKADGYYGEKTMKAIEAFQRKNGIHGNPNAYGVATMMTMTVLFSNNAKKYSDLSLKFLYPTISKEPCSVETEIVVKEGSTYTLQFRCKNNNTSEKIVAMVIEIATQGKDGKLLKTKNGYNTYEIWANDCSIRPATAATMYWSIPDDFKMDNAKTLEWRINEVVYSNGEVFMDYDASSTENGNFVYYSEIQ